MVQCPFCHFSNEEGALFCEQCKSDLAGVAMIAEPAAVAVEAVPMAAEAMPMEAMPMEATPIEAMPIEAMPIEAMAMEAMPIEAMPIEAMPGEAIPMEATPVEATPVEALPLEAAPVEATPFVAEAVPLEPTAPATDPITAVPSPPVETPPAPVAAAPPPPPPPTSAPAAPAANLAGKEPKLIVLRGNKRNTEYPIYEGQNFVGRADEKPVDIDLEDQEPPDRVWSSRQHACIFFENGELSIEDLNSSNGTFVNRARIYPGQKKGLNVNDVVQIGTVQLKVIV
jgi:hypothetical protein